MSGELKIMYGTETYNNSDGAIDTAFNRHATDLVVYMTATKSGAEIAYYRFIAVFDGTYYRVYRQVKDSGDYPALTSLTISGADIASGKNLDTTEKVAEFIASTASISDIAALAGAYLDFSINYVIKDAAGNASVAVDNLTVRGVTYVRYESEVAFSIEEPAAANIAASGDNSFTMTVNQGASIASILSGFVVSNKDYAGVNHVANLKQSLYYNGEAIFENIPYPGIHELVAKLQKDGHRLYLATAKPEVMALRIMDRFDLAPYFELICGASLDLSRDSKAAVIAYLLEQIPDAQQVIMVGDTAYDVVGAAEHGIPTIGVSWGYGKVDDLSSAGAVAIANTMDELY
jgi:phosphoglycolate phosphatase-like HAD superfamily hydrolase